MLDSREKERENEFSRGEVIAGMRVAGWQRSIAASGNVSAEATIPRAWILTRLNECMPGLAIHVVANRDLGEG